MNLRALQTWLLDAVTAPDGVVAAAARTGIAIDTVIEPSDTMTASDRLAIYASMYWERLLDAIAPDYPGLRRHLGDGAFRDTLRCYAADRPSRHYSLSRFGHDLADWLAQTRPGDPFASELAQLERTLIEVFHAQADEPVTGDALVALPPAAFAQAHFQPNRATRLLTFQHAVSAFLAATRTGDDVPPRARGPEHVMVFRQGTTVRRRDLDHDAFALLEPLIAGLPLGAAIEQAEAAGADPQRLVAAISTWFRDWVGLGWFRAIEIAAADPA